MTVNQHFVKFAISKSIPVPIKENERISTKERVKHVEKQPRISQNITMKLAGKNMAVRVQLESIEEEIKNTQGL